MKVTVKGYEGEEFTVKGIDENTTRPFLREDLIRRGFDGNIYELARVVTGRKKPYTIYVHKSAKTGIFQ